MIVITATRDAYGAEELARYLRVITDDEWSVTQNEALHNQEPCIWLGDVAGPSINARRHIEETLASGGSERFTIQTVEGGLWIRGNRPRSTLYGVYQYLRTLGCDWLFPGKAGEIVSKGKARLDGFNIVSEPKMAKRGTVDYWEHSGEDWADFSAKTGLNTSAGHWTDAAEKAAKSTGKRDLEMEFELHLFDSLRCTHDAQYMQGERDRLRAFLTSHRGSTPDLFLWLADESLTPCQCQHHAGMTVTDQTIEFINEMLYEAQRMSPDARLCFLAYVATLTAPASKVKPEAGVLLEWAPIFRSYGQALDDPSSAANRMHLERLKHFIDIFGPDGSQALEYWLDFSLFSRTHFSAPVRRLPCIPHVLQRDLQLYRSLGMNRITTFSVGLDRLYYRIAPCLLTYVYPHLLWDPDADVDALVETFCTKAFGHPEAVELHKELERLDSEVWIENHSICGTRSAVSAQRAEECMKTALGIAQAENDPVLRDRWKGLASEFLGRI
jgi:hypothetical protein